MSRRYRVVIPSSTAHLAKRLAQPFSKRNLLCAARTIAPALFALALSGVAHAQGTMDFSGAATLMATFNMGAGSVPAQIILPNGLQIIPEQLVRPSDGQQESLRNLHQRMECWVVTGSAQIGDEIFCDDISPFRG